MFGFRRMRKADVYAPLAPQPEFQKQDTLAPAAAEQVLAETSQAIDRPATPIEVAGHMSTRLVDPAPQQDLASFQPASGSEGARSVWPPRRQPVAAQPRSSSLEREKAAALGDLFKLALKSAVHNTRSMRDCGTLLQSAIEAEQFAVAGRVSRETGRSEPAAAVIWALLAQESDAQLRTKKRSEICWDQIAWTSGSVVWVVEEFGEPLLLSRLKNKLRDTIWKDRIVRSL